MLWNEIPRNTRILPVWIILLENIDFIRRKRIFCEKKAKLLNGSGGITLLRKIKARRALEIKGLCALYSRIFMSATNEKISFRRIRHVAA